MNREVMEDLRSRACSASAADTAPWDVLAVKAKLVDYNNQKLIKVQGKIRLKKTHC